MTPGAPPEPGPGTPPGRDGSERPGSSADPPPFPTVRLDGEWLPSKVAPTTLAELMRSDAPPVLLDVRPWEQRSIAHLAGDRWIPLEELRERESDLPRHARIVVYCHRGRSARQAASILRASGLTDVAILDGGIDEYARVVDPSLPRYRSDPSDRLVFQQFPNLATGCLAYLLHDRSSREAVLVDPGRDVTLYVAALAEQRLRLRAIVETHTHADHLSGHRELHVRTGAPIYLGHRSGAQYPHVNLHEGEAIALGSSEIVVLETPGHTFDHVSLRADGAVFTGDTLLPGSCGRTDLGTGDPDLLWESLTAKLLRLPDETEVFPAHYGRLHGLPPPERYSSTIGFERLTNEALTLPTREAFVGYMTEGWPPTPASFEQIVRENLRE